jgi:protein phosphatase
MFKTSSFSCAGRKGKNQDSILIEPLNDGRFLIAIADGMGGHIGGDIASELALNTVKRELVSHPGTNFSVVFDRVQQAFIQKTKQEPELSKMGTTLTVCIIDKNKAHIAHVGDTRLYHLRNSGILSRTKDQTEVQKLLDDKVLSKARAKKYHRKNILLSVMSAYREYEIQESSFELHNSDRLILFTDGAYSLVSKREVRDLSLENNDIKYFLNSIQSLIESREIKDDYTAVVLEFNRI